MSLALPPQVCAKLCSYKVEMGLILIDQVVQPCLGKRDPPPKTSFYKLKHE